MLPHELKCPTGKELRRARTFWQPCGSHLQPFLKASSIQHLNPSGCPSGKDSFLRELARVLAASLTSHVPLHSVLTSPSEPCLSVSSREKANLFHPSVRSATGEHEFYENVLGTPRKALLSISPGTLCHCQTLSYGKQMRITDFP